MATITFIHYGAKSYDPSKFDATDYEIAASKPGAHKALWGSPLNSKYGWKEFWKDEGSDFLGREFFLFRVREESSICIIDSVEDLNQLVWNKPHMRDPEGKQIPVPWETFHEEVNWQETSKKWSAVMITTKFLEERSSLNPRDLSDWDCESVVVLDPEAISPVVRKETNMSLEMELHPAVINWNARWVDYSTVSHTSLYPIKDMRIQFAEMVIKEAKVRRKQRVAPWKVEQYVSRAIAKAHHLLLECNPKTEVGVFNANRWADAISLMVNYIDSVDKEAQLMEQSLTYSCSRRKKADGTDVVVPRAFYPDGKVRSWKTLLKIDPRLDMTTEWDHGQKESYVALSIPVMSSEGVRGIGTAFTTIRKVGNAELGLPEPRGFIGDDCTPEEGQGTFDVIDEERTMKHYSYSPEREEEWLDILREGLEYVSSLNEIVALYEGVQKLWGAKAFRFHIYKTIHNEVVRRAFSIEAIREHRKVSNWRLVGEPSGPPVHGEHLRERLEELSVEFLTARLAGNVKLQKKVQKERGKVYRAYIQCMKKYKRSALWAWNNFLASEGMGCKGDGALFGDKYDREEDALSIKGMRAGDGSLESIDRLLYGSEDEEGNYTYGEHNPIDVEEDFFGRETPTKYDDLLELAASRFGSSRGASVDLLKPWKQDRWALSCLNPQEPREASSNKRVVVEDYSISDEVLALWKDELQEISYPAAAEEKEEALTIEEFLYFQNVVSL